MEDQNSDPDSLELVVMSQDSDAGRVGQKTTRVYAEVVVELARRVVGHRYSGGYGHNRTLSVEQYGRLIR